MKIEDDLKEEDNLKNEDDIKNCEGGSQTMFPAPDTFKSGKWQTSYTNWNYSG